MDINTSCKNIDDSCIYLDQMIQDIDQQGVPPIPYVGQAGSRFHNPPAPHIEITYLTAGASPDLLLGDQPHPLVQGQLSIHSVLPGNYSSHAPHMSSWCLFFDCTHRPALMHLARLPLAIRLDIREQHAICTTFEHLTRICYRFGHSTHGYLDPKPVYQPSNRPGIDTIVKGALLQLLGQVRHEATPSEPQSPPPSPTVQQATELIHIHYRDPDFDLPALACRLGLTPNHLGRLYRQHTGTTPIKHLQHTRLQHARQLLIHSSLRINEIATQVGIRDPLYLSRLFHRHYHQSPRRYRQTHTT